jgi:hypothetical protein
LRKSVIVSLPPGYLYVAPTLPPGAHRRVMKPSADLSLPGMARLAGEFLDRLGLADVTLVSNDGGGAITQMLINGSAPPGRAGGARLPRGVRQLHARPDRQDARTRRELPFALFGLVIQQIRVRPLRLLPNAFGWLPSSPTNTRCAAPPNDSAASASSHSSSGRKSDQVTPPEHGRRLAGLLPRTGGVYPREALEGGRGVPG